MCVMCLERGASCDLGQVRPTFRTFSHEMKPRCRCPSRTPSGIGEGLLWLGFIHMDVFSQTRAVKGYNRCARHSTNSRQSRTPTKIKNTQQARESKQRRRRWACGREVLGELCDSIEAMRAPNSSEPLLTGISHELRMYVCVCVSQQMGLSMSREEGGRGGMN